MTSLKKIWANKNYRTATIIAVLCGLWLASGTLPGSDASQDLPVDASKDGQQAALTEVRGRHIQAQMYPLAVSTTAQSEAERFVDVKAEVTGQVEALPVAEGAQVEEGEVICRIAVEDRELRLVEAQAAFEQAEIDYDGALRLQSGGYQSKTAIANARARLESTRADLLRRKLDLEKTRIRAPFAGIVEKRAVEIGDLMRPGDSCATILDLDPLVVSAEVSEEEVLRLAPDMPVQVRLPTGERVEGAVRYISRRATEATRTFRVEAVIENADMRLISGITADLDIQIGKVPAHLISASLLSLDEEGRLGVRVLDAQQRVEFHYVNLVGDAGEGIWVTGLPESTVLITVGHQYVGVGQQVAVVFEDKAAAMSDGKEAAASAADKTAMSAPQ